MDVIYGTPDGGGLSPLNGDWVLAHDGATGRFVRRFTVALPTAGLADGIRWQPDTGLTLSFPTFDYDARAAGVPEGVSVTNNGSDGVKLAFPAARAVLRVKIADAQSADVIEARRVDGDVTTEDAFASASHGTAGATLDATDRQLVLRQKRGGTGIPLRATGIDQVVVRSVAANVRVGVAVSALGADVFYLGPDAGTVLTNPVTTSNLGPALATLLQGVCDRLTDSLGGAALAASVPVTLIIESDTPARAHVAGFVFRYRLYRHRFDDRAPKRVLDFAGGALTTRQLAIEVPRGAALWSATLRMMGPFEEQGGDTGGGVDGGGLPPPASPPEASDLGVELRAGDSAATRVMLMRAVLIEGATVELIALVEGSAGSVRLQQDEEGKPGETLGEGALAPVSAGTRRVVRIDFDQTRVAGAGPVWVVVECHNGALVWLTAVPGSASAGRQVLRRAVGNVLWTPVGAASDRGAMVSFVTGSGADGPGASAGGAAFHGVQLQLAGMRLRGAAPPAGSAGEKETRFSIASAIAPLVQSASAGTLVPLSLSLMSSEPGRVTVYPPEFEFDP